jgi:nucleotide-binding universal stress UspA family protein
VKINHILAPIDFSNASKKALKTALKLAVRYRSKLTVVYAALMDDENPDLIAVAKAEFLKKLEEPLLEKTEIEVKYELIHGYSAQSALLAHINHHSYDLVVLGAHGKSGAEHFLLGSVAEKVVRYAPIPVLTISAKTIPSEKMNHIVIPFDYSNDSIYAVKTALEFTEFKNAQLDLIYVIDKDAHPSLHSWGVKPAPELAPDIVGKAKNKMDEILETIPNPSKIKINKIVASGKPHKEIASHIKHKGADLLIITAHGFIGIDRFLLGSTTERLIRSIHLPILTLKQKPLI